MLKAIRRGRAVAAGALDLRRRGFRPDVIFAHIGWGEALFLKDVFPAARVLLNTFERFGIVLADGGTVALTAESDRYTTAKWADLGVGSRIFDQTVGATDLAVGHFEVLDGGARIGETWECVRSALTSIFEDGFEAGSEAKWSGRFPP